MDEKYDPAEYLKWMKRKCKTIFGYHYWKLDKLKSNSNLLSESIKVSY